MINEQLFVLFSQLNKTSVCKYYSWELQLILSAESSSHSNAIKINQKDWLSHRTTTVLSHFLFGWFRKVGHCYSKSQLQRGSRGMKRPWPLAALNQWHKKTFGTRHACYTIAGCDASWAKTNCVLCASMLPCVVRWVCSLFEKLKWKLWHFTQLPFSELHAISAWFTAWEESVHFLILF